MDNAITWQMIVGSISWGIFVMTCAMNARHFYRLVTLVQAIACTAIVLLT